jgi:uncharacterized protein (TIGR03437 family)
MKRSTWVNALLPESNQMNRPNFALLLALAPMPQAFAQTYAIQTAAGVGWNLPAVAANFSAIQNVALDSGGNLYLAIPNQNLVLKIDPSGQLSLVAGIGSQGFSGDGGPAILAALSSPSAVGVDSSGNVFIQDTTNNRIREVSNGIITTVAGGGETPQADGGPATSVQLGLYPNGGLAVDAQGSFYFASAGIRKVSGGIITTIAGTGFSLADNVSATSAYADPAGIAVDASGTLYFADSCSNRIRKVSNGQISTVAGNGSPTPGFLGFICAPASAGPDTGSATGMTLDAPVGVAVDTSGNVYFMEADGQSARARKVADGKISTVAGGFQGFAPQDNIPATSAQIGPISGIAVDPAGNLYIPDYAWVPLTVNGQSGAASSFEAGRLRKVSNGIITTIAGSDLVAGDGGPATSAQLIAPTGLALDNAGNLYVSDWANNVVREISGGVIHTVIGDRAVIRDPGSGPASSATLLNPNGVATDNSGNVYLADGENERVIEVNKGSFSSLATNVFPVALAIDPAGNVYFNNGNAVIESLNGNVNIVAGSGTRGYAGDNGPAINSRLAAPSGLAIDSAGNIYIADAGNQRIRRISNGTITTIAGNGTAGFSGDNGPATSAQLNLAPPPIPFPGLLSGLAVDSAGNLYIADAGNQRVRMVSANGTISTIAGNGTQGFSGDGGPALNASFDVPTGIAVSPTGAIYIADSGNGRVRVLTAGCNNLSVAPTSATSPPGGGDIPIAVQTGPGCAWAVSGLPNWITLQSPPAPGPGVATLVVAANPGPSRNANLTIAGQQVSVTEAPSMNFWPAISLVGNAFGDVPLLAPNTWMEIKGTNLAPAGDSRTWQSADFIDNTLPTSLDGVTVLMNGVAAYVYSISAGQINVLSPPMLPAGSPVLVQVLVAGVPSPPVPVPFNLLSPSLFVYNGGPYVIAVHLDGSRIGPTTLYPGLTTPAKPGETILLFANGFGPPLTPIVAGSPNQSGSLPYEPVVNINGTNSIVESASLISPGLFQFNVILPTTLPDGDNPIIALVGPSITQPGTMITIQH